MYSIYHFFAHLIRNKQQFRSVAKLDEFPFDDELLSCRSGGLFPDMAVRINTEGADFTGGELIELKDSEGFSVASFNSTIPTGKKEIRKIVPKPSGSFYEQMTVAGDDVYSMPIRSVFYLIRGRNKKKKQVKVCLVHGSFFETFQVEELIRQTFSQVFAERIAYGKLELEESVKDILLELFSDQESFSKTRDVEKASVRLRFRVMAAAKIEANILNAKRYPKISVNTLNLVVPLHSPEVEELEKRLVRSASSETEYNALNIFTIKHWLNGDFLVFQTEIGESS